MLVNAEHRFITQRIESSLALLKPSFHSDELWVDGPNLPTLKLKIKDECKPNDVIIKTKYLYLFHLKLSYNDRVYLLFKYEN
jgi:hypothetical protein